MRKRLSYAALDSTLRDSMSLWLTAAATSTVPYGKERDILQSFQNALADPGWIDAAADHTPATESFRLLPPLETLHADAGKREPGFSLLHDTRLSRDGTVSYNTCHKGMRGGADAFGGTGKPRDEDVAWLMSKDGLRDWPRRKQRRPRGKASLSPPDVRNLRERDFSAQEPERKWVTVTDITQIKTDEGWLYPSVVLVLFSKLIVGWSMHHRQDR